MAASMTMSVKERNAKLDEDRKAAIQKNGEYFGYPQCCIDAYASAVHSGGHLPSYTSRPKEQIDASEHGFIPCLTHAKQILANEITLAELILPSRQHSRPFPETDYRNIKRMSSSTPNQADAV